MQLDPDQREWLYREEQERLKMQRRMVRASEHPRINSHWVGIIIAVAAVTGVLAYFVSIDDIRDLLSRVMR